MSRTSRKTIGALAALVAATALVPGASSAQAAGGPFERTATERGQAVGEPGEKGSAALNAVYSRTRTERGQAVGEPGEPGSAALNALYSRTRTELGQRVTPFVTPGASPTGFAWGDAAIGAGSVLGLALIGFGGVALVTRRRGIHNTGVPVASA
jgi:hypothetical protein